MLKIDTFIEKKNPTNIGAYIGFSTVSNFLPISINSVKL